MMQANWSLILNILLLIGVVFAIRHMMKVRRENLKLSRSRGTVSPSGNNQHDEIIAVRKINQDSMPETTQGQSSKNIPEIPQRSSIRPKISPLSRVQDDYKPIVAHSSAPVSIVMFLLAKENRQLAGYELLQTVLSAGLRYGEGNLFHRHQSPNGQGPILCSLAAATPTGIFDLQNIGAFSVHGLCLYMQSSGNSTIDADRFEIMLDTAKQLSEGLDTHLLDDQKRPLTASSIERYHRQLCITAASLETV